MISDNYISNYIQSQGIHLCDLVGNANEDSLFADY